MRYDLLAVAAAAVLSLVTPVATAQVFGAGEPYAGTVDEAATITLDVKDRPLGDVLNLIRDRSGANILLAPGVEATVTVAFSGVPWREALEIVAERAECVVIESRGRVFKVTKPPRVSFSFQDEDIRKVIEAIAQAAEANIIISPEVQGLVTMVVKNRPWRDALDNVVKTLGFAIVEEERGVLRIVTPAALEEQLDTSVIELKYLRPPSTYVASIKTDFAVGEPKAPSNDANTDFPLLTALRKQLSKNGEIEYFDKQNAVFIKDIKPVIDNIRDIVERLDIEPAQIFVDVKFVTTQTGDNLDVAFGLDDGIVATMNMAAMPVRTPFSLGDDYLSSLYPLEDGIDGDDPASFTNTTVITGLLDFRAVRLAIRLQENENRVEVIQAPKLITLDHQEATVFVGDIIRYAETSSATNQAGGLAFSIREAQNSPVETGFQLLVIPHVVPGTNKILMTVIPQARFLSGTTDPTLEGFNLFGDPDVATISLPQITSQTVVTNMMLESGQTGVIGGLITDRNAKIVTKVPWLGDIPIIGFFFRRTQENENHNNLLVLLTPVIIRGSEESRENLAAVLAEAKTKTIEEWEALMGTEVDDKVMDVEMGEEVHEESEAEEEDAADSSDG
jgi:type IV pilus assembly protein PilQ